MHGLGHYLDMKSHQELCDMKHKPFLCPYAIIFPVIFLAGLAGYLFKQVTCPVSPVQADQPRVERAADAQGLKPVPSSDDEWQRTLTPAQYQVCRVGDDEPAFSGTLHNTQTPGTYCCVACGACVFTSAQKVPCSCGWPCFSAPANAECTVKGPNAEGDDIRCRRCGSHLGRLILNGTPTRYQINALALEFHPNH